MKYSLHSNIPIKKTGFSGYVIQVCTLFYPFVYDNLKPVLKDQILHDSFSLLLQLTVFHLQPILRKFGKYT